MDIGKWINRMPAAWGSDRNMADESPNLGHSPTHSLKLNCIIPFLGSQVFISGQLLAVVQPTVPNTIETITRILKDGGIG